MLLFIMKVRLGVITLAANLSIFGPILSIPVDLFTFSEEMKFTTNVSFVGANRNSVLVGTLDLTKSFKISKSDGIIGSLRFEATLTKYELKTPVKSDSLVITRSPTLMFKLGSSLIFFSVCSKLLEKFPY